MNIKNEIYNLHIVATTLLLRELSPTTKQFIETSMIEIGNAMAKQMGIFTIYSDIDEPETVRFVWVDQASNKVVPLYSYNPPKDHLDTPQRQAIEFCVSCDAAMLALKNKG